MSYEIVLQSEAIWDLQEAFDWYENRKKGLGFEFIEEVESGYLKISEHPLINSVRHVKRKPKH